MRIHTTMKRSPRLPQLEKSLHGNQDPTQQRKKKDGLKIKKEERGTMWYSLLRILGLWATMEAIKFLCKNRPWAACKIQSSHVCGAEKTEACKGLGAAEDGIRSPPNLTKYFSQQTRSVTRSFSQKQPNILEFRGLCSRTQPWRFYLPRNPKVVEAEEILWLCPDIMFHWGWVLSIFNRTWCPPVTATRIHTRACSLPGFIYF